MILTLPALKFLPNSREYLLISVAYSRNRAIISRLYCGRWCVLGEGDILQPFRPLSVTQPPCCPGRIQIWYTWQNWFKTKLHFGWLFPYLRLVDAVHVSNHIKTPTRLIDWASSFKHDSLVLSYTPLFFMAKFAFKNCTSFYQPHAWL